MLRAHVLYLILFLPIAYLGAQSDIQKKIQTDLIMVEDGGVVEIPAGHFTLSKPLSLDGKKNVTIKGAGINKSTLSFKGQKEGAEGLKVTNAENIKLIDFAVEDTKGDAIKTQDVNGIQFIRVKTAWTGKPNKKNGAYGVYPVQCQNVLIDECVAIGASDAGIYVGQSDNIVVKNCRAEYNVAGIEIENSTNADVYNNVATNNTGGILIFDLPGLIKKKGGNVRVYNNKLIENNYKNFAPKGNIVGEVPSGTGILILSTSDVEVFNNEITDNKTFGVGIASYLVTERPIKDETYNPYPTQIYVHDNTFKRKKQLPSFKNKLGIALWLKFKRDLPSIVWDGIADKNQLDENGILKAAHSICVKNNINATFANLDAGNKFKNLSKDATLFNCERAELKGAEMNELTKANKK